jgi:hypothetical protein
MTANLTPERAAAGPSRTPRVSPTWLGVREAADAAARAADLVAAVRGAFAGAPRLVIHDLGCGTGAVGRWLAPQLPGRQHWIMYDHDPVLLARAPAGITDAAGGARVTVETRQRDIAELTADDLAGADLVTAGALLDLLTVEEVDRIAAACVGAGCSALFTISVTGRVDLDPSDPLDKEIAAAFNTHQRRLVGARRLLGPDAVDATVRAFSRRGVATVIRPSPWQLGDDVAVLSEWLAGWLEAACEQAPELAGAAAGYARRRLAEIADGRLRAVVHHVDLLARRE